MYGHEKMAMMKTTSRRVPGSMRPPRQPSAEVPHAAADREQEDRQGEDDVRRARDQRVRIPAEEAGCEPEHDADQDRDSRSHDGDDQRGAGAVEDAHEDVAPGRVRAEPEVAVGAQRKSELVRHLTLEELVWTVADEVLRDDAGEDGEQHEHRDRDETEHRGLVALEPHPEELPRRLAFDRSGDAREVGGSAFDFADDRHANSLPVMTCEL
jgi:hypothetical protein